MSGVAGQIVDRDFFARDPLELAPDLLGKLLVGPCGRGRIVEVEAYRGEEDPASHAFRGPTPRNRVMFGPAGHLYVYRSYGMHWCANVVASHPDRAGAVLIRALQPVGPIDEMSRRRPAARRPEDLANGPGKLCAALGIMWNLPPGVRSAIACMTSGMAPASTSPPTYSIGTVTRSRWRR